MNQILLLRNTEHRRMGWKPPVAFEFAARYNMVPVGLPELPGLLPVYPLGFFRAAPSALWQLMAMTGFRPGHNLFVAPDGRWTAPYIPRSMLRYPFALQLGQGAVFSVGILQDSGALREAPCLEQGEQCFFDEHGQPSSALAQVVQDLQNDLKGQQLALRAMQALETHNVLEPWPGAVAQGEGAQTMQASVGLFRVSESKLNALDGDALKALQQANALALAYAQLLSLGRMEVLHRLDALYARKAQAATAASPPDPAVVQKLFDPGQPDTIQFNW